MHTSGGGGTPFFSLGAASSKLDSATTPAVEDWAQLLKQLPPPHGQPVHVIDNLDAPFSWGIDTRKLASGLGSQRRKRHDPSRSESLSTRTLPPSSGITSTSATGEPPARKGRGPSSDHWSAAVTSTSVPGPVSASTSASPRGNSILVLPPIGPSHSQHLPHHPPPPPQQPQQQEHSQMERKKATITYIPWMPDPGASVAKPFSQPHITPRRSTAPYASFTTSPYPGAAVPTTARADLSASASASASAAATADLHGLKRQIPKSSSTASLLTSSAARSSLLTPSSAASATVVLSPESNPLAVQLPVPPVAGGRLAGGLDVLKHEPRIRQYMADRASFASVVTFCEVKFRELQQALMVQGRPTRVSAAIALDLLAVVAEATVEIFPQAARAVAPRMHHALDGKADISVERNVDDWDAEDTDDDEDAYKHDDYRQRRQGVGVTVSENGEGDSSSNERAKSVRFNMDVAADMASRDNSSKVNTDGVSGTLGHQRRGRSSADKGNVGGHLIRDTLIEILHELARAVYIDYPVPASLTSSSTSLVSASFSSISSSAGSHARDGALVAPPPPLPSLPVLLQCTEWFSVISDLLARNVFVSTQVSTIIAPSQLFKSALLCHNVVLRMTERDKKRIRTVAMWCWLNSFKLSQSKPRIARVRRVMSVLSGWIGRSSIVNMRSVFRTWRSNVTSTLRTKMARQADAHTSAVSSMSESIDDLASKLLRAQVNNAELSVTLAGLRSQVRMSESSLLESRREVDVAVQRLAYSTQVLGLMAAPLAVAMDSTTSLFKKLNNPYTTPMPALQLLAHTKGSNDASQSPSNSHTQSQSLLSSNRGSRDVASFSKRHSPDPPEALSRQNQHQNQHQQQQQQQQQDAWRRFQHFHTLFWREQTKQGHENLFGGVLSTAFARALVDVAQLPSYRSSMSGRSSGTGSSSSSSNAAGSGVNSMHGSDLPSGNPLAGDAYVPLGSAGRTLDSVMGVEELLDTGRLGGRDWLSQSTATMLSSWCNRHVTLAFALQGKMPPVDCLVDDLLADLRIPALRVLLHNSILLNTTTYVMAKRKSALDARRARSVQISQGLARVYGETNTRGKEDDAEEEDADEEGGADGGNFRLGSSGHTSVPVPEESDDCMLEWHIVQSSTAPASSSSALFPSLSSSSSPSSSFSVRSGNAAGRDKRSSTGSAWTAHSLSDAPDNDEHLSSVASLPSPLSMNWNRDSGLYSNRSPGWPSRNNPNLPATTTATAAGGGAGAGTGEESDLAHDPYMGSYVDVDVDIDLLYPSALRMFAKLPDDSSTSSLLAAISALFSADMELGCALNLPQTHRWTEPERIAIERTLQFAHRALHSAVPAEPQPASRVGSAADKATEPHILPSLPRASLPSSVSVPYTGSSPSSSSSSASSLISPHRPARTRPHPGLSDGLRRRNVARTADVPLGASGETAERENPRVDFMNLPELQHPEATSSASASAHEGSTQRGMAKNKNPKSKPQAPKKQTKTDTKEEGGGVGGSHSGGNPALPLLRQISLEVPPSFDDEGIIVMEDPSSRLGNLRGGDIDNSDSDDETLGDTDDGNVNGVVGSRASRLEPVLTVDRAWGVLDMMRQFSDEQVGVHTQAFHEATLAARRLTDASLQTVAQVKATTDALYDDVVTQATQEIRSRAYLHAHDDVIPGIPASFRYACSEALIMDIPVLARAVTAQQQQMQQASVDTHGATFPIFQPKKVHKAVKKLERVFARCSRQLQSIFFHYARGIRNDTKTTNDGNRPPRELTMSHVKFWRFIRDCKLGIKHSKLVDQIVQLVLIRKAPNVPSSTALAASSTSSSSSSSAGLSSSNNLALGDLTFSQFHEVLIRLALLKFPGALTKTPDPVAAATLAAEEAVWKETPADATMAAATSSSSSSSSSTSSTSASAMDVDVAAEVVAAKVQMLLTSFILPNASHSATSSTYMQMLVSEDLEVVFTRRTGFLQQLYQHYAYASKQNALMTVADAKQFAKDYGLMSFLTAHELKTLIMNIKSDLFTYTASTVSDGPTSGEGGIKQDGGKDKDKDKDKHREKEKDDKDAGLAGSPNIVKSDKEKDKGDSKEVTDRERERERERERQERAMLAAASAAVSPTGGPGGDDDDVVPDKAEVTYREFLELLAGIACFVQRSPYLTHPDKVDQFIENQLQARPLPKYHVRAV